MLQRKALLVRATEDSLDSRADSRKFQLRRRRKVKQAAFAFQLQHSLDRLAEGLLTGKNIPVPAAADTDLIYTVRKAVARFQKRSVGKHHTCLHRLLIVNLHGLVSFRVFFDYSRIFLEVNGHRRSGSKENPAG